MKKICPNCGAEFENARRKYCSEECLKKVSLSKVREYHRRKRQPCTNKRICPTCGKKFESIFPNKKYCSLECRRKRRAAKRSKTAVIEVEIKIKREWTPALRRFFSEIERFILDHEGDNF